jgi:clan AA aspartic protease (TIGR02281 family)
VSEVTVAVRLGYTIAIELNYARDGVHRRFILWFVGLFFVAAAVIIGGAILAPDSLGGHEAVGRLFLSLAIIGLCGIVLDAFLQVRAGARVVTSLVPLVTILLIMGVTFPGEIAALAKSFVNRESSGIRCAPGEDGRFRPRLMIAGQSVDFVLDTSVDDVVLTTDDADRIGIDVASLAFDDEVLIGDARSAAAIIELDDVRFGSFAIADLPVKVSASALGGNVLGMEFLDRFSRWHIENGVLILEP